MRPPGSRPRDAGAQPLRCKFRAREGRPAVSRAGTHASNAGARAPLRASCRRAPRPPEGTTFPFSEARGATLRSRHVWPLHADALGRRGGRALRPRAGPRAGAALQRGADPGAARRARALERRARARARPLGPRPALGEGRRGGRAPDQRAQSRACSSDRPFARRCSGGAAWFPPTASSSGRGRRARAGPSTSRCRAVALFAIAGLYERWHGPGGEVVDSFTLLTRPARGVVATLHDRMPLIVDPARLRGLARSARPPDPAGLLGALPEALAGSLVARPVSTRVNDVHHDDPDCLAAPESRPCLWAG